MDLLLARGGPIICVGTLLETGLREACIDEALDVGDVGLFKPIFKGLKLHFLPGDLGGGRAAGDAAASVGCEAGGEIGDATIGEVSEATVGAVSNDKVESGSSSSWRGGIGMGEKCMLVDE